MYDFVKHCKLENGKRKPVKNENFYFRHFWVKFNLKPCTKDDYALCFKLMKQKISHIQIVV